MKRSSTITLLALVTLVVLCILSPWAGFSVMQAQEGWCCRNGEVFPSSQAECEEMGGSFFATPEEAEKHCQAYAPPQGWCCLNGEVFPSSQAECDEMGGSFFATPEEAEKHCQAYVPTQGWCCLKGRVFSSPQAECEEMGGSFFATPEEAEKHCQAYAPPQGWCCLNGEVFPSSQAECEEMGGSFFATPEEAEKHCQAHAPAEDHWWWLPPVIVTIAIVATITLVFRHSMKMRRRKQWQEKAEEEEPSETCQPCTRHCRKIELELKPALRKVTHLALTASPPVSSQRSQKKELKNEVVDRLSKIVMARRRGEEMESLQRLVVPLADLLLQQIREWLHLEPAPRDVSIAAHLEGGKITFEFILYHCRRRGNVNVWEEVDKWKKTFEDERDESIGILRNFVAAEAVIPERLVSELTRLLMEFIQKV